MTLSTVLYNRLVLLGTTLVVALLFLITSAGESSTRPSPGRSQSAMPSRWVSIAFSNKRNNGTWAASYAETFAAANAAAIAVCESTGGIKCSAQTQCGVVPPRDPRRLRFAAFARDSFVGIGGNRKLTCGYASMKDAEEDAKRGPCDPAVSSLKWGPCTIVWSASIYP